MAELYPITLAYRTGEGDVEIVVERFGPDAARWEFRHDDDRIVFGRLPTNERLDLRGSFEAQVALAINTPSKGDT